MTLVGVFKCFDRIVPFGGDDISNKNPLLTYDRHAVL